MTVGPALPDVGLIAVVPDSWGPEWQSRHHLVSRLAAYFQTVWCDPPSGWRETTRDTPWFRIFETIRGPTGAAFDVYTPPAWAPQLHRPSWLAQVTWTWRVQQAVRRLRRRGAKRIVLAMWRPQMAPALHASAHDLSLYLIDDEYTFSDEPGPTPPAEAELAAAVDQIVVHSLGLLEEKGRFNPHTVRIPLGVDFARFSAPAPASDPFGPIPRPRLVYVGRIKRNLDWPALELVARQRPDWQVVLCGTESPHSELPAILKRVSSLANFHFLPGRPSTDVPAVLQYADVCLLPYAFTRYNDCIYPLKLHEYLASGRPVVGSAIRSLLEFDGVIHLARTPQEWPAAIEAALSEEDNSASAVERRRRVAQQHDWDVLVRRLADVISERLGMSIPTASAS